MLRNHYSILCTLLLSIYIHGNAIAQSTTDTNATAITTFQLKTQREQAAEASALQHYVAETQQRETLRVSRTALIRQLTPAQIYQWETMEDQSDSALQTFLETTSPKNAKTQRPTLAIPSYAIRGLITLIILIVLIGIYIKFKKRIDTAPHCTH